MDRVRLIRYARLLWSWKIAPRTRLTSPPEDISIEITNVCNFRCHYCPQSNPDHFATTPRTFITVEQAIELLARLRRGGVATDVIHWTLDGEPFLHAKFPVICDAGARSGFVRQVYSSNGSLATPERLLALPRRATHTICIDYCAEREQFETWRGPSGSWEAVRTNLDAALAERRLSHVSFELSDIAGYRPRDGESPDGAEALRALFPSPRVRVTRRLFHNMTGSGRSNREPRAGGGVYHLCPYPWLSLTIASNGDVVACCRDLDHKTVLGNLLEQELPEIWNGERYRSLREHLLREQPEAVAACRSCDLPYDDERSRPAYVARTAIHRLRVIH